MREFLKKYSSEIVIGLSAMTAILNTLLTHEGVNAVLISILIALVAIAVEILKHGFTKEAVNLITNLAVLLLEELGGIKVKDNEIVATTADGEKSITFDEIRERLLEK